ncbi:prolipoprotein diacylglyceryl transferase [Rhodococcus triatomae]|nr:hypothetical protein G419_03153 [Rhodococcus triatomae BKS 15-14]
MSNQYTDADRAEYEADIDAIATDPTLSPEEKSEALTDRYEEELDAIDASFADGTDTATTGNAPATESVDEGAATDSVTEAAPTDAAETSAATEGEAVVADGAEPAGAASAPTYYSPRDVDADGNVDVVYSTVDGVDTVTHLDDDGNVTLTERDVDGNGTYEEAWTGVREDGTVRVAEDRDDDGDVDLATFIDPETGNPVRQDVIDGSQITETLLDTDGDGAPDTHLIDTDGDGRFDTVELDTDADGLVNEILEDTDGDGAFDVYTADADSNGDLETYVTADEAPEGLGNVSTYESNFPADDHYQDQM